jgi:hypothetical protein
MKPNSKSYSLLLAFCLVATLAACSIDTMDCTKVSQSEIYQDYSVSYDADEDETAARATFRAGGATGTTLNLDGSCSIAHNSISIDKDGFTILGTHYSGEKSGLVSSSTFTFTNNDGDTFVNAIATPSAVSISSPPATISRSAGVTIAFSPAVAASETVTIYIDYQNGNSTGFTSDSTSTVGATQVTLAAGRFSSLGNYAVTIQAQRSKNKDLDQASTGEGGYMQAAYRSGKSAATLVD